MTNETLNEFRETFLAPTSKWPADLRTELLFGMVCDLMMEVEVLRTAVSESQATSSRTESTFRRAYQEVSLETHNSRGLSSGTDKVLALFYPRERQNRLTWRELLMLRRLGFSDCETQSWKAEAEHAELLT